MQSLAFEPTDVLPKRDILGSYFISSPLPLASHPRSCLCDFLCGAIFGLSTDKEWDSVFFQTFPFFRIVKYFKKKSVLLYSRRWKLHHTNTVNIKVDHKSVLPTAVFRLVFSPLSYFVDADSKHTAVNAILLKENLSLSLSVASLRSSCSLMFSWAHQEKHGQSALLIIHQSRRCQAAAACQGGMERDCIIV